MGALDVSPRQAPFSPLSQFMLSMALIRHCRRILSL